MRFSALLILLSILSGCAPVEFERDSSRVAPPAVRNFSYASDSVLKVEDDLVFVDTRINRLLRFSTEPLELVSSVELAVANETQWVAASADGAFYFYVTEDSFGTIASDGNHVEEPFEFAFELAGFGFDSSSRTSVLLAKTGEIGVAQFDEAGQLTGSYVGDENFGQEGGLGAIGFSRDGRLVACLGTVNIAIVDVAASISEQSWQRSAFDLSGAAAGTESLEGISWIGPVVGQDSRMIARDADRLLVIDLSSESVSDEESLSSNSEVGFFRDPEPHFLVGNPPTSGYSSPYRLYTVDADGEIMIDVISSVYQQPVRSFYQADANVLILGSNELTSDDGGDATVFTKGDVYRYNTESGTLIDESEVASPVRLALTSTHLLFGFQSALGLLERRDYGEDPGVVKLENFNIEGLQETYE